MLSNDMLSIYPVRYLYGSYNKGAWTQNKAYKTAIPYRTRIHYDKIFVIKQKFRKFLLSYCTKFSPEFFFHQVEILSILSDEYLSDKL